MASTLVNTQGGGNNNNQPLITRGRPQNVGTITAAAQAVQFTVSALANNPNGFDSIAIFTTGNLVATGPILEVSIDGGTTWAGVVAPTNASSATTFNTTVLNADPAVTTANGFTIAGLSGLGLFRFGFTTYTSGSGAVWIAIA